MVAGMTTLVFLALVDGLSLDGKFLNRESINDHIYPLLLVVESAFCSTLPAAS